LCSATTTSSTWPSTCESRGWRPAKARPLRLSFEIGPKPWKLLYVLWTEGRIDVPTLYERVWGMGPVKRLNLRAAVHRANEALNRLCERRLIVQLDDDTISLEGIGLDWGERVA
jgi:hypothetical protein